MDRTRLGSSSGRTLFFSYEEDLREKKLFACCKGVFVRRNFCERESHFIFHSCVFALTESTVL